jgi:hypothetical protein
MSADQSGEGGFIATIGEGVQQMLIAILAAVLGGDGAANLPDAGGQCGTVHDGTPSSESVVTFF